MSKLITVLRPWTVWLLAAAFYFSMYIPRVAPNVMSFDLMESFNITALALGSLSACFFYPYLLMQIPVGMLVDHFSTRKLLTVMVLLCAIATYSFSQSTSLSMAYFSRFLLGFSSSFAFVSSIKLASEWFVSSRIGLLAGLTQSLGMLGAFVGQKPMADSVVNFGWRDTLVGVAIMLGLLAILIAFFVRDRPAHAIHHVPTKQENSHIFRDLLSVLKNPQSWFNGLFAGFLFAPTAVFGEMWGNTYLKVANDMDVTIASFGVGLIFVGWGIGSPFMGWLSDRIGKRRPLMFISAILSCILMCILLYVPNLPVYVLFAVMFLFGLSNTGLSVAYAVASEINPHHVAGTSMGVANLLSILVGAVFQLVVGWVVDLSVHTFTPDGKPIYLGSDFQLAMLTLPACIFLAFILVFFIKETYCKPLDEREGAEV